MKQRLTAFLLALNAVACRRSDITPSAVRITDACKRIGDVKLLSLKATHPIEDSALDDLVATLDESRPCIIEMIADATPASEKLAVPYDDLRVGDIALYFLDYADGLSWSKLLPADVRADAAQKQASYTAFLKDPKNRIALHEKVRDYYAGGFTPNPKKIGLVRSLRAWNAAELKKESAHSKTLRKP